MFVTPRSILAVGCALAVALVTANPDGPVGAQAPAPVTAADLAALTFRSIGPANMSGRFVDMDVVESDPYVMYVASATGGIFKTTDRLAVCMIAASHCVSSNQLCYWLPCAD